MTTLDIIIKILSIIGHLGMIVFLIMSVISANHIAEMYLENEDENEDENDDDFQK
jgi:hypothetical protein